MNPTQHYRWFLPLFPAVLLFIGLIGLAGATGQPGFGTYLGDARADRGYSVAMDRQGNTYVTGMTSSTNFPTAATPLVPSSPSHRVDAFVAKFDSTGSSLEYMLWFNAQSLDQPDEGLGIAVDSDGSAYVTGQTRSEDFCRVFGAVPGFDKLYNGNTDAFVMKVKPDGSGLVYCTFLGGSDRDVGQDITLDEEGNAYIVGSTWSTDFPTTGNAAQPMLADLRDILVARLDSTGTSLEYSTFLGGVGQEEGKAVALDIAQQILITGWTNSDDMPVTSNAVQNENGGGFDAFLASLDPISGQLSYSSYLGGTGEDRALALRTDPVGNAILAGYTNSSDFPTTGGAFAEQAIGGIDAFVTKLSVDASSPIFSTYLGGSDDDWARGLDVDGFGMMIAVGETRSGDFPTTPSAAFAALSGTSDAYIAGLSPNGATLAYGSYLGGGAQENGFSVASNVFGEATLTGATDSDDFPVTPGAYDTTHNGSDDVFVSRLRIADPLDQLVFLPMANANE
ncbi:MAG: SBBP repeat-containing protein [Chloroflexota bacterium]|nr:SBBP repeat-containing protein [Chloroflexota bacterium]